MLDKKLTENENYYVLKQDNKAILKIILKSFFLLIFII